MPTNKPDVSPAAVARVLRDVLRRIPMNVLEQASALALDKPADDEQGNAEDVIDLAIDLVRTLDKLAPLEAFDD